MALSSISTTIPSCHCSHSIFLGTPKLSPFGSLPSASPRHLFPSSHRRLATIPQRRIIHRVQAMKETFSSLDELLKTKEKDKLVLVEFYATWSNPCQYMVPILEEVVPELEAVSEIMKDKIEVVRIDTDKYSRVADYYRIEALPTFIIFINGKSCDRFEGAMPKDILIRRIYSHIPFTSYQ
ncbi:thioredoxin Y, chloroplastic-like isoform X1 [Dioscorea cayenensis subsp. rotundata]|uniref:Thioredoxin Y, chloroplastic-like isoform X1 n=1 Tax=Dioscorea cayennensis subsp. rotundata TaxID=55577 RepID=A0AB40CHK4_DIOCR|nr:thioredoxin Y, chloroplastic-like isoform X1 [Dioscorea cayenensis subsp. rotundata]